MSVPPRRRAILLVEDNPDDVVLTIRAFQRCQVPHTIEVVADGEDALAYLSATGAYAHRDASALPDVVLLDLQLPRVDGLEVLQRLRAEDRTRRLPVVVLTSSREERDIVRSYDLGANSFVRKPVDFVEFVAAAHQLGQFWLVLNEPPPSE